MHSVYSSERLNLNSIFAILSAIPIALSGKGIVLIMNAQMTKSYKLMFSKIYDKNQQY